MASSVIKNDNIISNGSEIFTFTKPETSFDNAFTNAPVNSITIIRVEGNLTQPWSSNNFVGLQWKNPSGRYGTQFIFGYGQENIAIRTMANLTWSNWKKFS